MNSKLKTTLIVLLALTTIGAGALAWQQSRALVALRIAQARDTNADRAALEKRLTAAERRAHDLQNELDALKARASNDDAPPPDDPQNAANGGDRRGRFRGPGGPEAFMAMMNDPQMVQLMNSREKLMLDSRYAALFKNLMQGTNGAAAMTPEQLDAFKNLLVEKQNTLRDVMMTARAQGVTDRSEINQLVKNAQADVDAQLQSTLGDAGYQQYQQYEHTLPQRNLVNQLSQSLSYTSTPLSDAQSQQLVQILADNSKAPTNSQLRSALGFGGPGGAIGVKITDAAIAQAQSVLAPAQVQALATLQQQQKAQQALTDAMRANRQSANAAQASSTQSAVKPTK